MFYLDRLGQIHSSRSPCQFYSVEGDSKVVRETEDTGLGLDVSG